MTGVTISQIYDKKYLYIIYDSSGRRRKRES